MKMTPKRLFGNLIILSLMVGILVLDHWVFQRLFHVSHWRWYIENGVEISFVAAAMALVSLQARDVVRERPVAFRHGAARAGGAGGPDGGQLQ